MAEQKSRQRAELLQDVLTHDIRNYNQIALLQIEFLSEELKDNSSAMVFSNNILDAIQGTTDLVSKAERLTQALSLGNELTPVDLAKLVEPSLDLIRKANPKRVSITS